MTWLAFALWGTGVTALALIEDWRVGVVAFLVLKAAGYVALFLPLGAAMITPRKRNPRAPSSSA
jgi:hypothetical protein